MVYSWSYDLALLAPTALHCGPLAEFGNRILSFLTRGKPTAFPCLFPCPGCPVIIDVQTETAFIPVAASYDDPIIQVWFDPHSFLLRRCAFRRPAASASSRAARSCGFIRAQAARPPAPPAASPPLRPSATGRDPSGGSWLRLPITGMPFLDRQNTLCSFLATSAFDHFQLNAVSTPLVLSLWMQLPSA